MLLYGLGPSRSTRISWALEEIGIDWQYRKLDSRKGEHRAEDYLRINPGGKVPALVDGEFILTESMAIITYLGEKYPASKLVPQGLEERANYFRWSSFAVSELEQPLWSIGKHKFVLPKEYRIAEMKRTALHEFAMAVDLLEQGLKGREFILGDVFTGADILLGHDLIWARGFDVPIESDTVNAYADRMIARPALVRGREKEVKG